MTLAVQSFHPRALLVSTYVADEQVLWFLSEHVLTLCLSWESFLDLVLGFFSFIETNGVYIVHGGACRSIIIKHGQHS